MPPKPKGNRAYKKGVPFRDARKFIVICEGEREAKYFDFFDEKSQKLIVKTIAPVDQNHGESAPVKLKERADEYMEMNGWNEDFADQLWFVLDVDKWPRNQIDELFHLTQSTKNWFISISNQCFEIWLYYHKSTQKLELNSSREVKKALNEQTAGGYKLEDYAPLILEANINSRTHDNSVDHYFPDTGITKVYKLGEEIVELLALDNGLLDL
jgi:hypothetical protein